MRRDRAARQRAIWDKALDAVAERDKITDEPREIPCLTCRGKGKFLARPIGLDDKPLEVPVLVECPTCEGKGEIEIPEIKA